MFHQTWKPDTPRPDDWRDQASCREVGHAVFFPEGEMWTPSVYEPAMRVCRRCPVQAECLEWALTHDERYGIWGGTLPSQRAKMKGRNR